MSLYLSEEAETARLHRLIERIAREADIVAYAQVPARIRHMVDEYNAGRLEFARAVA
jgi:hypothetical protein